MKHTRALAVTAAATLAFAGIASPALAKGPGGNNGNPNNGKKITRAVTTEAVMDHLEEFQAIADAHDGNRAAGTSGYEASARYVEKTLQAAGYETERQYFTFERTTRVKDSVVENSPTQRTLPSYLMNYTPSTPDGGITADLAVPSVNPQGCDADAYGGADLTGHIALVQRGTCAFAVKSLAAAAVGAEAVIIYNSAPELFGGTLGAPNPAYVPTVGISGADGASLLEEMQDGPVNMTVDLQVLVEQIETFNVLAETNTGRDDNVVMVGAHLDGVEDGPGINDNGSGSAALLETAVQLARVNKVNNTVRFAWWGAEEHGLIGSNHYVNDLVQNDPETLGQIATYLNMDMVGSPNYIIGVYDADESTYPAGVTPPPGSVATEKVLTDYFDSIGQPWVDTAYSGRSDYQAFILNGVAASGLFTGADGTKTEEQVEMFGGTAGITYDPNYHSPEDDITNISEEALGIMSDAIAFATLSLAQDTSEVNGKRSAGKSGKPHPKPVPEVTSEEDAG